MSSEPESYDEYQIDELFKLLNKEAQLDKNPDSLKDLFERKVAELDISITSAAGLLNMQYRTLWGILGGTLKTMDVTNLIKVANFLDIPKEVVSKIYLDMLIQNYPELHLNETDLMEFIKENFDLDALKKTKLIQSLTDFRHIEDKINSYYGLDSIFEYKNKRPKLDVAFSAGVIKPQSNKTRDAWLVSCIEYFKEINNTNEFNRKGLIEYFPEIRWHSTNVEKGFQAVVKNLYKLGVTVIYHDPFHALHLRGATLSVYGKPCIVVTNYKGFYPTIWFALIHELYHVLFDWDEINNSKYHLSESENELLTVEEKEDEANNFAREYLLSKSKSMEIEPQIYNEHFVNEFAKSQHVHKSFVYVFRAYDKGKTDKYAWSLAIKNNPDIKILIQEFGNTNLQPIREHVKELKSKFYSTK